MGLVICKDCQINIGAHEIKYYFKAINWKKEQINCQAYLRNWPGIKLRGQWASLAFIIAQRIKWGLKIAFIQIKRRYNLKKAIAAENITGFGEGYKRTSLIIKI